MKIPSFKNLWQKRNVVITVIFTAILAFNITQSYSKITTLHNKTKQRPSYNFIGNQFEPLRPIFNHVEKVGYLTDHTLENPIFLAHFSQTQYTLSPTILDLNNSDHEFVILHYKNQQTAINKILSLKMIPMTTSSSGIILAKKINKK